MAAMALVVFSLTGLLFLMTQWLQFSLGYTPLATGLRTGPIALVLIVVAPLSAVVARRIGTKLPVALGMLAIAVGLLLMSRMSVSSGYLGAVPALLLIGVGAGSAFAPATDAVMGSLPRTRAGVGSATNSTALQFGGALGVGVLGSLLNSRYQGQLAPVLAHYRVPISVTRVIEGSLGGALAAGQHLGGATGTALDSVARRAFSSGMDLTVLVGAVVSLVGVGVVLALLPNWAPAPLVPAPSASNFDLEIRPALQRHLTLVADRAMGPPPDSDRYPGASTISR